MSDRLQNEIEHGKYLLAHGAGEVWNWETPAGRIRWARRVKMLTSHLHQEQSVLELGCGTGYFTRELAVTGAQITAIDISSELLEVAQQKCSSGNVQFEVGNAYAMTFPDETFDSVVGSSVLHHLELEAALKEIQRVLKPGGSIYFTEPNMLEDIRAEVLSPDRLNTVVFGGFAAVALAIAVIGVAGVLAFSVSSRSREFGIRLALGSTPRRLLAGVVKEGLIMAGGGVVAGAIGGFALARLAGSYSAEIRMPDSAPVVASVVVLLGAAVIASVLPAARAARVNVTEALRSG